MSNLVLVHENKKDDVYKYIKTFLNSMSLESKNTSRTYEIAIKDFFEYTRKKELTQVKTHDLNYNLLEIEQYQQMLLRKYKRATVNIKIIAVKKLFDKLQKYGFNIDLSVFDVKKVKTHDTEHYDSLNLDEINDILSFLTTTKNGLAKSLLVKMAFATAFRKDSLLKLTWDNFEQKCDYTLVSCVGKGNILDTKKISNDLYFELLKIKENNEKVFNISSTGVQRMMDSINKNIDFGNRKITFHSFKKASIEEVGKQTNYDLKLMQRHGNHASVTTTLNSYLTNKDVDDLIVVNSDKKFFDNKYIMGLTNTQICDIINSMSKIEQEKFYRIALEKGFVDE